MTESKKGILFPVLLLAVLNTVEATPIPVSAYPQLFLDDYLVDSMDNLKRTLNQPVKHAANPLIVREFAWEKRLIEIYGTVLCEAERGGFRCWYLANEFKDGIPDNPEHPRTAEYYTCYAESVDGIHWVKPMVGLESFGAHKESNVIIAGTHGFCVLPTPDDPDPQRRYKGVGGALFGFSPDGIHWEVHNWRPAVGKNDTSSCVVRWNGEYLAYVRTQVEDPNWPAVMRGVGISVSQDFEHWSTKQTVLTTDAEDGYPWVQPYGISVTPYGDVLIGILWLLHLDHVPGNNALGDQDTQLVVSRDGRAWHRVAERAPFLTRTNGAWDKGRVFPGTTMFVKDDLVHIYYTGVDTRHGEGWGSTGIGLATLPADRFVRIEQSDPARPGVLETCPLSLSGSDLLVNAEVGEGELLVELLSSDGQVLPGFGREQSHLVPHGALRHRIIWQPGARRLGAAIRSGPLRLRFILKAGSLYAFQIVQ